jgi:hypothetical protein
MHAFTPVAKFGDPPINPWSMHELTTRSAQWPV